MDADHHARQLLEQWPDILEETSPLFLAVVCLIRDVRKNALLDATTIISQVSEELRHNYRYAESAGCAQAAALIRSLVIDGA